MVYEPKTKKNMVDFLPLFFENYFLDLNGLEQHVRGGEEMGCYFH